MSLKFKPLLPESAVNNLCGSMFQKFNLSFFDFGRLYDDGSCYLAASNTQVMEYLFQYRYPVFTPVPPHLLRKNFYYLIPTTGAYQQVIHDVRQQFNIEHCFDIFEFGEGYVDVCCFASLPNHDETQNIYINNLDTFKNFMHSFKEKITDSIKPVDNQINLPESMRLNFSSSYEIDVSQLAHFRSNSNYLSKRENEVLDWARKGKTAKETAQKLKLSPRTIEFYLENIKAKLKVNKKSELIEVAIDYFK